MFVPRTGFQDADTTPTPSSAMGLAEVAASNDPADSFLSYDYYIDTAAMGAGHGTFMQLGFYINGSQSPFGYAQNEKEVQLDGTALSSGQVFQGTVTVNMAAAGLTLPAAQAPYRLGFIINGDQSGAAGGVWYDNLTITTVPEPSTIVLGALSGLGLLAFRRRK